MSMENPETVAEAVGDAIAQEIEGAIETANETAERAAEMNNLLTEAALEGERGRRISELERRFDEWQSNQADTSEAIAALVLGLTELSAKMDLLSMQSIPAQQETPNPQSAEDGPRESPVEEAPAIAEAVAETPEAPPAPQKKKRRNWI